MEEVVPGSFPVCRHLTPSAPSVDWALSLCHSLAC